MAKLSIVKGSTSVLVYVFIQDISVITGAGLTGLVFNSSGLVCYYVRPLAAAVALTLVTQTVTGAYSSGGFVQVDVTNMPGVYRLDLSDAVCATGVDSVLIMLKGATNMAPLLLEIQLTTFNLNSATPTVNATQVGGTVQTAGDIIATIASSAATTVAAIPSAAAITTAVWAAAARTLTAFGFSVAVSDKTGFSLSTAGIQAIWDNLTSALTTVGSIGKLFVDNINATIASRLASAGYTIPPTAVQIRQEIDTNSTKLDAINTKTATLPADPADESNILAAIAALNNISEAQVNTQVDTALTDYDAPTHAELVSEIDAVQSQITGLSVPSAATIATTVWAAAGRTLSAFGFDVTVATNNDKTGYGLSGGAIQAIWDALTLALTTAGSIGKFIVDYLAGNVNIPLAFVQRGEWQQGVRNLTTFLLIDATGTAVTELGANFTVQISKAGGAFQASAGDKAEIGFGWYSYFSTAGEAQIQGPVSLHITGAGAIEQNIELLVKPINTLSTGRWLY